MSPAGVGVGAVVALAVVVALAPPGALARARFRRHRPGVLPSVVGSVRSRRPSGSSPAPRAMPQTALVAVERVGGLLRRRLGRPPDPGADRRVGTTVAATVVTGILLSPLAAVPVAVVVGAVPTVRRRARRLAREREVRAALPDAVDLFRLAVGAGLSVHKAVDAVADRGPAPVAAPLAEARRRVELGERLGDALSSLDALGDAGLPLVAALRGAARYGSPLRDSLDRVAADARVLRRRRAEEDARRLPVQLLFPLVLCVLPAFGLLAVVPLLLASLQSLQL